MSVVSCSNITDGGGKAAMLRRLQQAGFRVPDFVVSPADPQEALDQLGTPVAVRSSASVEDGHETSFAGQFQSFLNLSTAEEVVSAIKQCYDSAYTDAVASYCRHNGIDPQRIRVDAVVQRMVRPELAGVAFTMNPVTGAEEVVIEACEGLASELLSGRQSALPDGHPLLERFRPEIQSTAREIQQFLGAPQDIEFAIEDGTLYVLQSRPITRIGFAAEPGEWTNADFRDGGVSSGVCSPLMWSLYELAWETTLKGSLRDLRLFRRDFQSGRMFFGRPYWNVGEVKNCLAQLPGFVEREFDHDLSIEITYEDDGRRTPFTWGGLLRAIPTLAALPHYFRRQLRLDEKLLSGGHRALLKTYQQRSADCVSALGKLIENEFLLTECNYFRTIFATSLAKMDFIGSFPESKSNYGALVSALPPLRHMFPVRQVAEIPLRDDAFLDKIIDSCCHHYCRGLDVQFPRWDEDREFVREMLRGLPAIASPTNEPRKNYAVARDAALARLPWWKRRSFIRKLNRLRSFVWLREEMRDLSNQVYYLVRRLILDISQQRGIGDDVFFMTFREILADDRRHVEGNRAIYESYRNFRAPNEIGVRYCGERHSPSHSKSLNGIAASPGVVSGRAHVARNVPEALRMAPGDILVCPFTDPGWTPALDRAAGVVTETGGLLSHAAVICREYGIPAVLGVAEATSRIRSGTKIVVWGGEGHVEIADSKPKGDANEQGNRSRPACV